jgi:hypothetical protein
MRIYSSAITDYRLAGKAFWPIHFISIKVKQKDDPEAFVLCNFCTSDDDMTVTITDPDTDEPDERVFGGGGHIIQMGDLTRSEGAVIRSHSFSMSGTSSLVQDMVYGYNSREALFQWFIGEVDQDTGQLIDEPPCEFVGIVNTVELKEGALQVDSTDPSDSYFMISVDSLAAAMTDRNFDMRTSDVSQARGGDKFFEFADSAHHWNVRWGKEKKREKDRKKKDDKGGNGGTGRKRAD